MYLHVAFFIDTIADEFHITLSPHTQLKTSAASILQELGEKEVSDLRIQSDSSHVVFIIQHYI